MPVQQQQPEAEVPAASEAQVEVEEEEEDEVCAICYGPAEDGPRGQPLVSMGCRNCPARFHATCIAEWAIPNRTMRCPACQQEPCPESRNQLLEITKKSLRRVRMAFIKELSRVKDQLSPAARYSIRECTVPLDGAEGGAAADAAATFESIGHEEERIQKLACTWFKVMYTKAVIKAVNSDPAILKRGLQTTAEA